MEDVRKCKNFLSTLIKLASSGNNSTETAATVRELVKELLEDKLEAEEFTSRLAKELSSSHQPRLVPFLKRTLPALRQLTPDSAAFIQQSQHPQPASGPVSSTSPTPATVVLGSPGTSLTVPVSRPQLQPGINKPGQTHSLVLQPQQQRAVLRPQSSVGAAVPGMAPRTVSQTAGPTVTSITLSKETMEDVRKCKNFLSTLIKLASSGKKSTETAATVRELVKELLEDKLEAEEFTSRLAKELSSSHQPRLVPFLKRTLPALRQLTPDSAAFIQQGQHPQPASGPVSSTSPTPATVVLGSPGTSLTVPVSRPQLQPGINKPGQTHSLVLQPQQQRTVLRPQNNTKNRKKPNLIHSTQNSKNGLVRIIGTFSKSSETVVSHKMSPKRSTPSQDFGSEPKRRRKMLTIAEKVELLDMLKEGRSYASVGRHYGINESNVRYIKKDEKNIRKKASVTVNTGAKRVVISRNKDIVSMESALAVWISDCRKNNIALDTNIIREKARQLYNRFTDGGDDIDDPQPGPSTGTTASSQPTQFNASKGWFDKFQKRFNLKSVSLHGEAASADKPAADEYVNETFPTILKEGGYSREQVFNMDETGLFWKRMPSRTFIMKEEARAPGFKEFKDRLTLIMCGNAAGFMIKPALIYKSKNPRALKNKNKNLLPVHWMHNPKAWITKALTSDWFHQCFVPEVKLYLAEKGLEFKVLLLMDNAGGHAIDLSCQGVQIEFLPPNTTALIQPMDQGVIRAFKALYTRNSLQHLVEAMDEDKFSLKEYWCGYTIFTCLQNIQKAIKEMKTVTLNACWKKLWPEAVNDYEGFSPEEIHKNAVEKAVRLAKLLGGEGFNDMTSDDVNDLIETHSDPLTDEDLTELTKSASEDEDDEHDDPEEEHEAGLTLERLSSIVRTVKEAQSMAESWDPDMIRSLQFRNAIDGALHAYKNLLQQKKKQAQQLPITMYFSRKKKEDPGTATDDILPLEEAPDEEVLFEEGHE